MTLARTPYARLSPADIGQVDRELKKLEQMSAGLFVPKVLVHARSPYTVQGTDTMLLCDCTAGPITLTFPLAARVDGMSVQVVKSDTSTNAVTLTGTFSGVVNPTITVAHAGFTVSALNGVYHVTALVTYPIVTGETGVTSIVPPYGDLRRHGGGSSASGATNFTALQNAQASISAIGGTVTVPAGTFSIGTNTFLNVHTAIIGILKPAAGVAIYVQAPMLADISQHFDLSGGGLVYFNNIAIPEVFPEWFGAVGAVGTDDTVALQQAIDSVAFNNAHLSSPVTLSGATYQFTQIDLGGTAGGGNGVWLRGAGNYATTLLTTLVAGVAISMNRPGCRLTDLRVQTAAATTPNPAQVLVQSVRGNACRIERVECIKYYNGIQASGVTMDKVSLDYGLDSGIGIDLSDSIGSVLSDVRVAARYNASACFLLQGVNTQPDTNEFYNCSTGSDFPTLFATYGTPNTGVKGIATSVRMAKQVGGFQPRWTRFVGCLFETLTNSVGTPTFDYQAGQDTKLIGCYLYGGYYTFAMLGATAKYLNDHVLEATIIFGAYINGVYHNPSDTTNYAPLALDNCTVVDNSQNAIGGWPGVQLGPNSRGYTQRGGSCGTTVGQPVMQQFGVAIDAAARDYFIDVDTIDFTGNTIGDTSGLIMTVASAANVTPPGQTSYVSGVAAITNILLPKRLREWRVVPTGLFTWNATGNVAVAGSAVVGKLLIFHYAQDTGKWYPSYIA